MLKSKKIFSLISFSMLLLLAIVNCSGAYAYEVSSEDSDIKIDKFQPSSGVKIKSSNIAQAMENATYNATHKGEPKKDTSITPGWGYGEEVEKPKKTRDTSVFRWY